MEDAMTPRDYRGESSRQRSRAVAYVARGYAALPPTLRFRVAEAISSPDFIAVTLFSAIGLLATLNVILRIPSFGMM
jgi:hypothetical protein